MATLVRMQIQEAVSRLVNAYPAIFEACQQEHRRDPETGAGLSARQASILDHLDRVTPTGMTKLAEHLGVTPSTMSLHVDRLVAGRWVTRTREGSDRRRVALRLTEAGERMQRANSVLEASRVAELLTLMPAERRRAGVEGLEALAGAARDLLAGDSRSRTWAARRPHRTPSPTDPT